MKDARGREIDYMRISVTDRCNLRCRYCMPDGIALSAHDDILSYEEFLRAARAAVILGIVNFKVTGGEPLARKGCVDFIAALKALPGVRQVTLTTNALLLAPHIDALEKIGIDGINISLDTLDDARYAALTKHEGAAVGEVLRVIGDCAARGLRVKTNTVMLGENADELAQIAAIGRDLPVDTRFIELMPIGEGGSMHGPSMAAALALLRRSYPDLHPVFERRGNGPAQYYASAALTGRIGFISAVSQKFCESCNRIRLTAEGALKPCLCYEDGIELREILRSGASDEALSEMMRACILEKPGAHCFSDPVAITERKAMYQIGG